MGPFFFPKIGIRHRNTGYYYSHLYHFKSIFTVSWKKHGGLVGSDSIFLYLWGENISGDFFSRYFCGGEMSKFLGNKNPPSWTYCTWLDHISRHPPEQTALEASDKDSRPTSWQLQVNTTLLEKVWEQPAENHSDIPISWVLPKHSNSGKRSLLKVPS